MYKCYKCSQPVSGQDKPGFQDVCESCGSYLHCCMNCRFYDEHGEKCTEPVAEWVSDKWEDDDGIDDSARLVKGGSYGSFTRALLRISERVRGGVTQHDPSVGFRVVIDPSE